jgi:dihydroflavonol-4-reductase
VKMKIAVIGASGMLGAHIAHQAIARGHELIVVHRASSRLEKLKDIKFESRIADLGDAGALSRSLVGVDAVIHAAAYYPTVPRHWKQDQHLAAEQMRIFLDATKAASVPKIVYVGAAIALRKNPDGTPGDERLSYTTEPNHKNGYLQCKWIMDKMALEAAASGQHVVVGIPLMTFGEYDDGATTGRLVLEIARGTLPAFVNGLRNVIYAPDAGRGLVMCAEAGKSGERYLIAGHNTSMTDLVELIARKASKPKPKSMPLMVARIAAKLASLKYRWLGGKLPKLTESAVAVMASGQFIDGSKAARELGYMPDANLEQTIERSIAWFRSQNMI